MPQRRGSELPMNATLRSCGTATIGLDGAAGLRVADAARVVTNALNGARSAVTIAALP